MKSWKPFNTRALAWLTIALSMVMGPVAASPAPAVIEFSSLDPDRSEHVHGTLYRPESCAAPCPAVVVVHGTAGINATGAFYREAVLQAGIAFFEVDFKTGIFTSPMDRPPAETFVPMGFAALKELRKVPGIDPQRIGIVGFSMGGHLTVNTAFEANRRKWMGDEKGFAAHAAFYPVCKSFLSQDDLKTTGAPILIFYGTADTYGEGKNVPAFKQLLQSRYNTAITTVEYAGAQHGFNRNAPPLSYRDPAAIDGKGYMAWDEAAATDSKTRLIEFLGRTLGTAHAQ